MGRTTWIAAGALFGALTGSAEATAEATDPLTLQVMIKNEIGIPLAALRQTQAEVSRIFRAAGITLTWLPPGDVPANSLIIKIVETRIGQKSRNPKVLGFAPGSKEAPGRVAWLYHDRIRDLALLLHLEVSQLLGHVMAHEMGHLLLPNSAHTAAGLMKGRWDTRQAFLAASGALRFEPSQAALIRTHLRRAPNR